MYRTKWVTAAMTVSLPLLLVAEAWADAGRLDRQIPAQDLEKALMCFSSDRGVKLSYQPLQVRGLTTHGVNGILTAQEELGALLAGTGLTFMITGENTVTLVAAVPAQSSSLTPRLKIALGGGAGDSDPGPLRLAQGGQGANTAAAIADSARLDEVVVTAQKRVENPVTVPVPVTALQASDLQNYNQLRIQDYFSQFPGLSIAPNVAGVSGNQQIAVRGIIAGQGLNPTVGVTIDGVPYGSSISNAGGGSVPDIDPSELARVELLRGPQGTLYGANSLGGQLQYVTIDPSTDKFNGQVSAGTGGIANGINVGYNTRAAVNIPLTNDLAARASFFTRRDPGYIDDITNDVDGINERKVYGGHFAALWTPFGDFSVKFSALFQHTEQFGSNFADVPQPAVPGQPAPAVDLNQLVQMGRVRDSSPAGNRIQNYSLTLHDKIGSFDLTSISSFGQNNEYDEQDFTLAFHGVGNPCVFPTLAASYYQCYAQPDVPPATGDIQRDTITVKKYTQELRLATPLGKHVDWLFGLFYSKELSDYLEDLEVANPATGGALATYENFGFPMTNIDEAAFTDFTFKINPKFDVQVGGRANVNRQRFVEDNEGGVYLQPDFPVAYYGALGRTPPIDSTFTSYTYLLTPRYFLLQDDADTIMTYARFASGFRPGGPNENASVPGAIGVPLTYGPDKTYDEDLGVKADLFDRRLTIDLSVFYIDWKNVQISEVVGNGDGAIVNGSRAKSQGVEFQTEVRPLKGLTIGANFTYDDARLRSPLMASNAIGSAGARLPFTAQYAGNFNVNQEFPLPFGTSMHGFAGAQVSYVGGRPDLFANPAFSSTGFRQDLPAYTEVNVRAGTTYNSWTAEFYVTNLTDRRGILSGGINEIPATSFYFITPRTVGVELTQTF